VKARHPVHVTLRVREDVPNLASALAEGRDRFGSGLVHFSVQANHLHLIAGADDEDALARGMQGLGVRIARALNQVLRRAVP
jgi:REP element-mobilizing transposase RayT